MTFRTAYLAFAGFALGACGQSNVLQTRDGGGDSAADGASARACEGQPVGTVCRAAAHACDAPERCDGSLDCPIDGVLPDETSCMGSAGGVPFVGACELGTCRPRPDAGACEGVPAGRVCRDALERGCDAPEVCDGASPDCPTDRRLADGTACTGQEGDWLFEGICLGGTCVRDCTEGGRCTLGACTEGIVRCDGDTPVCEPSGSPIAECAGTCVNLQSDPSHCGACGNACGELESCRGGECQPQVSSCTPGAPCRTDNVCANGTIRCDGGVGVCEPEPNPAILCEGSCVDTQTDPDHCGGCGNTCDGGDTCEMGRCQGEPGACTGRPSGTTCRPSAGPCDFSEACDGVRDTCPPDTPAPNGFACGVVAIGPWSSCTFDSACAETGVRSRSVVSPMCMDGSCEEITSMEMSTCSRDTDGTPCPEGVCAGGVCTGP